MSQMRYWVWLTTLPGLSLSGQLRLLDTFGTPREVFLADGEALEQVEGLTQRERQQLELRDLRQADRVLEDCREHRIHILTMQDAAYPLRLRAIQTPPPVLYYKGELLAFDTLPVVAVVGARNASGYGLATAKRMGYQLGLCGGAVVSGAAKGVDSLALEGALSAGAPVAAVLGNGLDIVYPSGAQGLYRDVEAHGCLISEFVPGTRPLAGNFPRRNRIMSGLSLGVLVVEAAQKSGSLITAEYALEQGRDLYAVPGNLGQSHSVGSNRLIQEGATLATTGWDVLRVYQPQFPERLRRREGGGRLALTPEEAVPGQTEAPILPNPAENPGKEAQVPGKTEKRIDNEPKRNYIDLQQVVKTLTQDERKLVEVLRGGQLHVDDIILQSELPAARALASLTLLEVKGYVTQQPGKRFDLNLKNT